MVLRDYTYTGYPYSYEEQLMHQNAPLNANVAGFGAWLRYPFNKNKRINAGFQEDTGSFNAPITDYNTTGNGTTDWNSGFVTGQMQQEQVTRPQYNQLNLTMDYQSNTEDNPIVEMNSGNVKESNDNTQGFNIGGSWGNAIAPAATNIANAFLDTEASTADRVAGALGISALAKQWTADTTKGDAKLKEMQNNLISSAKPNYIQDASSTWGASNAVKLNSKNIISPISSVSGLPSLKDFKGNWWRNMGASVAQGAASGSVGGPWGALGGAVTGLLGSIGGLFGRSGRAQKAYDDFLAKRRTLMSAQQSAFDKAVKDQTLSNMQALANGNMSQRINDMANIRAYGGNLFDGGGNLYPNGSTIREGYEEVAQEPIYEGGELPEITVSAEPMPWYEKAWRKFDRNVLKYPKYAYNYFFPDKNKFIELNDDIEINRITDNDSPYNYILSNEFVEKQYPNTVRTAKDFQYPNQDTLLGDKQIPLSNFSTYYGIENGKLKAGKASDFEDDTYIVPNRTKNVGKVKKIQLPIEGEYDWGMPWSNERTEKDALEEEYRNLKVNFGNQEKYKDELRKEFDRIYGQNKVSSKTAGILALNRLISKHQDEFDEYTKDWSDRKHALIKKVTIKEPREGYVINENNDTLPLPNLNAKPKMYFADEDGNAIFVSGLDKNIDNVNNFLSQHPSYPIMVDNGRFKHISKDGDANTYTGGFMDANSPNNYIIGINTKAMGGNLYTDLSPNIMSLWNNKQQIDQQKAMNQQFSLGLGNTAFNKFDFGGRFNPIDPEKETEIPSTTAVNNVTPAIDSLAIANQLTPYQQAILVGESPLDYVTSRTREALDAAKEQANKDVNTTVNMMYGDRHGEADYSNRYDAGGQMTSADVPNGMQYYANGGSHEENPYGGIQVGTDQQGNANLVEKGEFRWHDFVFSDRVNVDANLLSSFNLMPTTKHQNKKAAKGKLSYADMAKKYAKRNKELENDPITKNSMEAFMQRLANAQEYQKKEAQLEAQKQNELQDYKTALNKQNNNPMYGTMKYNGMGNAATQQGVNSGVDAGMGNPMSNADLSNVNRSGNEMMAAYGGNLFWRGGRTLNLPPYGDPESRIDANQFLQGNPPVNDYGVSDFMSRIYSGNVGFGSPKTFTSPAAQDPITFDNWYMMQHENGKSPYIGSVNSLGERVNGATTYAVNNGNGQNSVGYNTAINTERQDSTGNVDVSSKVIGKTTSNTNPDAAVPSDPKEAPLYSTAGKYAQFGKGIMPMIWDWANKTNVKYDPNYRDADRLEALANEGPALRTADTIGGYRAPNLMDAERMNNAAQAQGLAALQSALSTGNGNRGFAAVQAQQQGYNTGMNIGNNYATVQQANNAERIQTDQLNHAIDVANQNAINAMRQDNQRAEQTQQQLAVSGTAQAAALRQRENLHADEVNTERMKNRAANQAAYVDNALNYFTTQAMENQELNTRNNDPTNPYWIDKDGRVHYTGDSGLTQAVRDAFGNDEYGRNGTFTGERLAEWNDLIKNKKYSAKYLKEHPELWEHLVTQQREVNRIDAEKAKQVRMEELEALRGTYQSNLARLDALRDSGAIISDPSYNLYAGWANEDYSGNQGLLRTRNQALDQYIAQIGNNYDRYLYEKQLAQNKAKALGGYLNAGQNNNNNYYSYTRI